MHLGKTPGETPAGKVITQSAINQPTVHTQKVVTIDKPDVQKGNTDDTFGPNIGQKSIAQTTEKCTNINDDVHNQQSGSDGKSTEQNIDIEKGKETTKEIMVSTDLNISPQLLKQYDQFAQQLGLQDKDK